MVSQANSSRPTQSFRQQAISAWWLSGLCTENNLYRHSCSGNNRLVIIHLTVCVLTCGIVVSVDVVLTIFCQNIYLAHWKLHCNSAASGICLLFMYYHFYQSMALRLKSHTLLNKLIAHYNISFFYYASLSYRSYKLIYFHFFFKMENS